MSTILDALRKVEEDNRARSPNARARLLLSPARTALHRSQRHRVPWTLGSGFVLAGFVVGAGLILWGPRFHSVEKSKSEEEHPVALNSGGGVSSGIDKELQPLAQPAVQPLAQATTDAPLAPSAAISSPPPSAPVEMPAVPPVAELGIPSSTLSIPVDPQTSPLTPGTELDFSAGGTSAVQHSPFVTPTPGLRELAVAPKPAPAPSSPSPKAQDGTLYEVLTPSGATRLAKPPVPAPANTTAPTAGNTLSLLQWSADPEKRIAFIRINGGPLTLAHEGDTIGGFTVVEIRPDAVELRSGETQMTLRAR